MELTEINVFIKGQSRKEAEKFKSKYLIDLIPAQSEYEYPYFGVNSTVIYSTSEFNDMWAFVFAKNDREYLFWFEANDVPSGVKLGQIRKYPLDSLCLSLSVLPELANKYYEILKLDYNPLSIYLSDNVPLPQTSSEIEEILKRIHK